MAKKTVPFKSGVTKRAEAKAAKARKERGTLSDMIKDIKQPIKLNKPFKRYWKIDKSPVDPKKRNTL